MFQLKLFHWQVIAGALFAIWQAVLRDRNQSSPTIGLVQVLEVASFFACATGVATGSRLIKARFEALGSNKAKALANAGYMKDRVTFLDL